MSYINNYKNEFLYLYFLYYKNEKKSEYLIIGGTMYGLFNGIGGLEIYKNHLTSHQFKKCHQVYLGSTVVFTITGLCYNSTFLKSIGLTGYMYI